MPVATITIYQLGLPHGQQCMKHATKSVRHDREETHNPQMHIVSDISRKVKKRSDSKLNHDK
jgi:hypothetical protein